MQLIVSPLVSKLLSSSSSHAQPSGPPLPSSALQGWLMPGGSPPVISTSTRPSGASDR